MTPPLRLSLPLTDVRRAPIAVIVGIVGIALSCSPPRALACPCASGDPALTQPEGSAPGIAMFRLGSEIRLTLDAYGTPHLDRAEVVEMRLENTVQFAPIDGLVFTLLVPIAYRDVTRANFAREQVLGLADPELRARFRLLRGRSADAHHELDGVVGVDLPIQPVMRRGDGTPVSMEAMIASGSADPLVGLVYRFREGPLRLTGAITWRWPTPGPEMTMGPSLDGVLLIGGAVIPELSIRGALEGRFELAAQMASGPMPNTGGGLLRLGGDVLLSPTPALMIALGVRGPVIDAMYGARDPGLTGSVWVMGELSP